MNKNSIPYLLLQGFKYFKSNKIMTAASVGVLSSCLFMIGNFYLISLNLQHNIKAVEATNEVVLFVEDNTPDLRIEEIKTELSGIENVDSYTYDTKEEALKQYKAQYPDQEALLSDLDATNPLTSDFRVKIKDINKYKETAFRLSQITNIYKVRSQQTVIDNMLQLGRIVGYISMWIMVLMLIAAVFIIVNTIRLASFYFRRQINIMKYIGATNWFIRWPFIVQGAITGLLAGLLTYFLQKYAYIYVFNALASNFDIFSVLEFSTISGRMFLYFVLGGLLVGISGSGISIGKYLKV